MGRVVAAAIVAAGGAIVYAIGGGPVLAAIARALLREVT